MNSTNILDSLKEILLLALENKASDIHLLVDKPPTLRIDGELIVIDKYTPLTNDNIKSLISPYMNSYHWKIYQKEKEVDFSFSVDGISRYRANFHTEMNGISLALRTLSENIPKLSSLNLPPVVANFSNYQNGLVLVTGATGSGKSTTLAALIDSINEKYTKNIITIEDPIEFVYKNKKSLIRQREVGRDTPSFAKALKGALRQDPDVILIGELRDLQSIDSALTAAETGHLVFGTLHTNGAPQSIDRLIDVFPEEKQQQIRIKISSVLRAVLSQDLLKCSQGGRVPATEILLINAAISNLILTSKTNQITSIMQTNGKIGMLTMETSLKNLLEKKLISVQHYSEKINEN